MLRLPVGEVEALAATLVSLADPEWVKDELGWDEVRPAAIGRPQVVPLASLQIPEPAPDVENPVYSAAQLRAFGEATGRDLYQGGRRLTADERAALVHHAAGLPPPILKLSPRRWKIDVAVRPGQAALQQTITYGSKAHVLIAWAALVEIWLCLARLEAAESAPQGLV